MLKEGIQSTSVIAQESIEGKILFLRGQKVMLDRDLAVLYGVETKALNQAVKRNIDRFPKEFRFVLTSQEFLNLKSQFVTSSWGGTRKSPAVFTEHGILMLSSILNSKRAILVNIQIMRTFTKLREMMSNHKELREKIEIMEKKYDYQFKIIFDTIKKLLDLPKNPKRPIGFQPNKM
ncbi:MAG: ORF6N domain-containing protein [Candidatus Omnitrophica bacterium]|nr:ORF6N domain-containing protein [Candidatus Omnitrophota bacterium]